MYSNPNSLGFQPRACCLDLWELCCLDYLVNLVLLCSLPVGGSESLRSYWKMYLPQVLLLIYVVDSADHARLPVAKQLLHQLVENNSTLPVVVLAHKQVGVPCPYLSLGWQQLQKQPIRLFKEGHTLQSFLRQQLTAKEINLALSFGPVR